MNDKAVKLLWQMVISTMAKKMERTWELHEQYMLETRLHVPVKEYIEWRKERTASTTPPYRGWSLQQAQWEVWEMSTTPPYRGWSL